MPTPGKDLLCLAVYSNGLSESEDVRLYVSMETNGQMAQIKDGQIYCRFTHLKASEALGA